MANTTEHPICPGCNHYGEHEPAKLMVPEHWRCVNAACPVTTFRPEGAQR